MATNNNINRTSKVTTFTSSGTWTKDTRAKEIHVIGWNGGHGGGSGEREDGGSYAGGGSGGGAGSAFLYIATADFWGASETVTIGLGGAGGAAKTTDGDGNDGSLGGVTSIGKVKCPQDGTAGKGGNSTATYNTAGTAGKVYTWGMSAPRAGVDAGRGSRGSSGETADPVGGTTNQFLIAASGGGGGGCTSVVFGDGGDGGEVNYLYSGVGSMIPGGTGGISAHKNGYDGADWDYTDTQFYTGGSGGGGGKAYEDEDSGAGGEGGFPGAGGGGGGGNRGAFDSGAGGAGGAGKVIVIEFF